MAAVPVSDPCTPLTIDFLDGTLRYRLRAGGGRGQALARAAGLTRGRRPFVVDATAGLGRDALLLAALGARVTLIERAAPVHALLAQAMERARAGPLEIAEAVSRMTLLFGDARDLLPGLDPEVVLVDPMHPPRRGSALVKKEMRRLRALVGADEDVVDLMHAALAAARDRVVLKWPRRAALPPGLPRPSHGFEGRTTRHDVFMTRR